METDNYDGDLTSDIEILGDYNLHEAGTYHIQLKVVDSSLNKSTRDVQLEVQANIANVVFISVMLFVRIGATNVFILKKNYN